MKVIIDEGEIGAIEVVNLFSKTSKSRDDLDKEHQIFENLNFDYIRNALKNSNMAVLAWGGKGTAESRNKQFINLITTFPGKLKCFDILNNKQPKYPRNLYADSKLRDCFMDKKGSLYFLK